MKKTIIIAEIGNNHNGNFNLAQRSIIEAKKAGADCVKFQYFDSSLLVHKNLKTLKHVKTHKYQVDRMKSLEFDNDQFIALAKFAKKNNLKFCLSFFSETLFKDVIKYVDYIKLASGDFNNKLLLQSLYFSINQ